MQHVRHNRSVARPQAAQGWCGMMSVTELPTVGQKITKLRHFHSDVIMQQELVPRPVVPRPARASPATLSTSAATAASSSPASPTSPASFASPALTVPTASTSSPAVPARAAPWQPDGDIERVASPDGDVQGVELVVPPGLAALAGVAGLDPLGSPECDAEEIESTLPLDGQATNATARHGPDCPYERSHRQGSMKRYRMPVGGIACCNFCRRRLSEWVMGFVKARGFHPMYDPAAFQACTYGQSICDVWLTTLPHWLYRGRGNHVADQAAAVSDAV